MKKIIHIAPDIQYLFNPFETVLCGLTVKTLVDNGEFVGIKNNLNKECTICPQCLKLSENVENEN